MKTRTLLLLPLLGLLVSGNCHRRRHHHDVPVIIVVEPAGHPNPTIVEAEPNDDQYSANDLGFLFPGDRVFIEGRVDTCCDLFDGFAFVAAEPLLVEVFLESHDGGDLDICVFDPVISDFSLCFENEGTLEQGAFEVLFADSEFHVVVTPFDFGSRYTLEVVVSPLLQPAFLTKGTDASTSGVDSTTGALRAPSGALGQPSARSAAAYALTLEDGESSADAAAHETLITIDRAAGAVVETQVEGEVPVAVEARQL